MRRTSLPLAGTALAAATLAAGLLAPTATAAGEPAAAPAGDTTCAAPDARSTVRFLDDDSGVPNRAAGGGCTINDLIDDERAWQNSGAFVAHAQKVSGSLLRADVISTGEYARLIVTAARSGIGGKDGPAPYDVIFDGSKESFDDWGYVGGRGFELNDDGSMATGPTPPTGGLGLLWYEKEEYGDFSLRLQFRDERADAGRSNSGVFVRFPGVDPAANPECRTNDPAWVSVNCGHEIQINDSAETGGNDPRKTGSVYGFADLNLAAAKPTEKGVWNDLEIRVVGQQYTVIRNGEVINEFENKPGIPFPGRPTDPGTSGRQFAEGYIGLQNHDTQSVVEFRNIRVRDLA
ncbi:3-keto-disaccharide hydrolase [Streptomyces sp. CMB-StM0423]|uniref:3-keto-disaccharide hydrolase n=1 Tax=Streptomyces sp. CMB-StM0423 TaxID=2059884 RepID=UPI000C7060B1|nr:DUF1080 domain-containing protein [Streptomyces sp. CMB-StM0423]AUH43680.1 DUF1080 domain-containing protein [Streptomyces sp. CMB-StM0423]